MIGDPRLLDIQPQPLLREPPVIKIDAAPSLTVSVSIGRSIDHSSADHIKPVVMIILFLMQLLETKLPSRGIVPFKPWRAVITINEERERALGAGSPRPLSRRIRFLCGLLRSIAGAQRSY
jgi:hypothetical protein